MILLALVGSNALWLLYAWLVSAAAAGHIAERKGYPEKAGTACGLLLSVVGLAIWLLWPARPGSAWKRRRRPRRPAEG